MIDINRVLELLDEPSGLVELSGWEAEEIVEYVYDLKAQAETYKDAARQLDRDLRAVESSFDAASAQVAELFVIIDDLREDLQITNHELNDAYDRIEDLAEGSGE